MRPDAPVGVVLALHGEARLVVGDSLAPQQSYLRGDARFVLSGMGMQRAKTAAQALVDQGVSGLLSVGFAGALSPDLKCGTVLLPKLVRSQGEAWPTTPHWHAKCCELLQQPTMSAELWTAPGVLAGPAQKQKIFDAHGALAVDMEAAALARVAHVVGLPFMAIKIVLDEYQDALPDLSECIDADGRASLARLSARVLQRPGVGLQLMRLAQRYRFAARSLRGVVRSLGSGFGLSAADMPVKAR